MLSIIRFFIEVINAVTAIYALSVTYLRPLIISRRSDAEMGIIIKHAFSISASHAGRSPIHIITTAPII